MVHVIEHERSGPVFSLNGVARLQYYDPGLGHLLHQSQVLLGRSRHPAEVAVRGDGLGIVDLDLRWLLLWLLLRLCSKVTTIRSYSSGVHVNTGKVP